MNDMNNKRGNMKTRRYWKAIIMSLSMIIVFFVTYTLILPAITLEEKKANELPGIYLDQPGEGNSEEGRTAGKVEKDSEEKDQDVDKGEDKTTAMREADNEDSSKDLDEEDAKKEDKKDKTSDKQEDQDQEGEEEEKDAFVSAQSPLVCETKKYEIFIAFDEKAGIPEGTELSAKVVSKTSAEYHDYYAALKRDMEEDENINRGPLFTLSLSKDGQTVTPGSKVDLLIKAKDTNVPDTSKGLRGVAWKSEHGILKTMISEKSLEKSDSLLFFNKSWELVKKQVNVLISDYDFIAMEPVVGLVTLSENGSDKNDIEIGENETTLNNASYPAQQFEGKAGKIQVNVSAPEGAFPKGTTMQVKAVKEANVVDAVKETVSSNDTMVKDIQAVDITFIDADGKEIEPEKAISVTMSSDLVKKVIGKDNMEIAVVHVPDKGEGQIMDHNLAGQDGGKKLSKDEISFEADEFSVYAIVETEKMTSGFVAADGNSYKVTVTYGAEAGIPQDSSLELIEYKEDSEEYQFAKNKLDEYWIAENFPADEKKPEDEVAKENNSDEEFGFSALGIRILDPNGKPIEPSGEVSVSIVMKSLPKDFEAEVLQETMEVHHLAEKGSKIVVEQVASPIYAGSEITADENGASVEFSTDSFSTYTVTWGNNPVNTVTLHFVDADGHDIDGITLNGNSVDNGTSTLNNFVNTNTTFDLSQFQKSGYTLSNTHIRSFNDLDGNDANGRTIIANEVRRNEQGTFQYRRFNTGNDESGSAWVNIDNDTNLYLVYSPTSSGGSGGGGDEPDDPPQIDALGNEKKVSQNEDDGTYKVKLSVTGSAARKDENPNANVIFVLDTSSSMNRDGRTWFTDTKAMLNNMVDNLAQYNTPSKPNTVEFALIHFNKTAGLDLALTNDADAFHTALGTGNNDGLTTAQGTNWAQGLRQAITTAGNGDGDPTFVVFLTDGAPSQYWPDDVTFYMDGEGCYLGARDEIRELVNSGIVFYGIFAFSTDTRGLLDQIVDYGYNSTTAHNQYSFNASNAGAVQDKLDEILEAIKMNFAYADVEIDDGITGLSTVTFESVDPESFNYEITYKDYSDPENYTNKTVNITVNGTGNNQTISIPSITYHVVEDGVLKERTTVAATIKGASFTNENNKSVTWNLEKTEGSIYMLEEGWTYSVDFKVWPSQASYDLVAALNNHIIEWGEDFVYTGDDGQEVTVPYSYYRTQVNEGETYSLKTNTTAGVKYRQITAVLDDNGNIIDYDLGDEKTVPIITEYAMDLTSQLMPVKKEFDDDINTHNPYTKVRFYLLMDGHYYQTDGTLSDTLVTPESVGEDDVHTICMDLDESNVWEDDIYIAPGFITDLTESGTRTVKVLEHGHKYSLVEKNITGDEYEYEFTPQTVRPMVVNGTLQYLVLQDDYNQPAAGAKTYTIGNEIYFEAPVNAQALIGTNRKTGELDITKYIDDPQSLMTDAIKDAETFTYKVDLTIPANKDASGIMGYEFVPRYNDPYNGNTRIYIYGYQGEVDDDGVLISTPFSPDNTFFINKIYGRYNSQVYRLFENTDPSTERTITVYMTLARNEVIRFTNLPTGTTYTITEIAANVGNANDGDNYPAPITSFTVPDGGTPEAQGYEVSSKSSAGATGGNSISGTISTLDTRYYNQFTNAISEYNGRVYAELKVKKVVEDYDWLNEYYRFRLAAGEATYSDGTTGTSPMPTTRQVDIYNTTPEHTASFGNIRYTKPGTYKYILTENTYYTYVDYADPVTITVTVEEQDGNLAVTNIEDDAGTTVYTPAADTATGIAVGLTTQTNKIKTINVSAIKEWLDSDGSVMDAPPEGTTVIFQLYKKVGEETAVSMGDEYAITLDGIVDENGESDAWKASWNDLPQFVVTTNEAGTVRTAVEVTYTIAEDIVPEGFEKVTEDPVPNGGTIQNKLLATEVSIQKRRQDAVTPLNGAKFDLYTNEGYESDPKSAPIKTDLESKRVDQNDGVIELGKLTFGDYYLIETTAPDGFNLLTDPVGLKVESNKVTITQGTSLRVDETPEGTFFREAFITNNEGVLLPMSGGIGTLPFTLVGLALVVAFAMMYVFRMKRGER